MRQRTANEKSVIKTLAFLNEIRALSRHDESKPLSLLYSEHHISKSTGNACQVLNIFEQTSSGDLKWQASEPNREMALQVLELLRRRNDKMVAVTLTGFESLVDSLAIIADGMKRQPKSSVEIKDNNLFGNADKKQDDLIKIVSAIAGGIYSRTDLNNFIIEDMNDSIMNAAQDLLTKIYK